METTSLLNNHHAGQIEPAFFMPGGQPGNSLVKGSISPTQIESRVYDIINNYGELVGELFDVDRIADIKSTGTYLQLSHRDWSDEYKLRLCCEIPSSQLPPDNAGERLTNTLSERGARALGEACEYVTQVHGGFNTFMTLTVSQEVRKMLDTRIAYKDGKGKPGDMCNGIKADGAFIRIRWGWQASIQREVGRFFDALSKMNSRGWIPAYRRGKEQYLDGLKYTPIEWNAAREKIGGIEPGSDDKLHYLWVAENPENGQGERNPHIHALMTWSIPWEYFPCWAHRIEKLWGQGFAKLERLRNKEAAGYYIAKAAGYLTKAANGFDQGPIRGNRYGMAQHTRAPGWVPVTVYAWGVMGHLMKECKERLNEKSAPLRYRRNQLQAALNNIPKSEKKRRAKVAALLTHTKKEIRKIPAYFGRFGAVFKGLEALDNYFQWADRKGWTPDKRPPRMWLGEWIRQCKARKSRRLFMSLAYDEYAMDQLYKHALRWEPVEKNYYEFGI